MNFFKWAIYDKKLLEDTIDEAMAMRYSRGLEDGKRIQQRKEVETSMYPGAAEIIKGLEGRKN